MELLKEQEKIAEMEASKFQFQQCQNLKHSDWKKSERLMHKQVKGIQNNKEFKAYIVVEFAEPHSREVTECWCYKE